MKKKFITVLTVVATIATIFTGCGKDVSGDYVATMKMSDIIPEEDLSACEEIGLDLGSLAFEVNLSLDADKNFTFDFDADQFKEDYSKLITDNLDAVVDAMMEMSDISRENLTDEEAQLYGYETADALIEDFEDQMLASMYDLDSEFDDMITEACKGTYSVSKNTISFVIADSEGISLDKGTIGNDGSITLNYEDEGQDFSLVFNKK